VWQWNDDGGESEAIMTKKPVVVRCADCRDHQTASGGELMERLSSDVSVES
jgi:hypothetical protein